MLNEDDLSRIVFAVEKLRNRAGKSDVPSDLAVMINDVCDVTNLLIKWEKQHHFESYEIPHRRRLPPSGFGDGSRGT